MANRKKGYTHSRAREATSSIRVVRDAFEIMRRERWTDVAIAEAAGINSYTISMWRHGKSSPNMREFEAALQAIGYRLEIVRNEDA